MANTAEQGTAQQGGRQVQVHIVPWRENCSLILPSAVVAEVIYHVDTLTPTASSEWIRGVISWRGLAVPLVSFEPLKHVLPEPITGESRRLLVCRSLDESSPYTHFAIEFYRLPRHMLVFEDSFEQIVGGVQPEHDWPFIARAQLAKGDVFVLDIDKLVNLL